MNKIVPLQKHLIEYKSKALLFPGDRTMRRGNVRRHPLKLIIGAICIFSCAALFPTLLLAETTARDVQIIVKSATFLTSKPSGAIRVNIVFDPDNPASRQDAESIQDSLNAMADAVLAPQPSLTPLERAGSVDGTLVILAMGVPDRIQAVVADAVRGRGILTASADAACARAGRCVIAVQAKPRVEILFNDAAGKAAGVAFLPTFLVMITEL
jgi:hypothetical protein